MFSKPDVVKLAKKKDIKKLGKLLRHKDPEIRHKSAVYLTALITQDSGRFELTDRVIDIFEDTDDDDFRNVLLGDFKARKEASKQRGDFRKPYDRNMCWAIYSAKGLDKLIELHQEVALQGADWKPNFHQVLSSTLIEIIVMESLGIETILKVIPYAYTSNNREAMILEDWIRDHDPIKVSEEVYEEVKYAKRFSPVTMTSVSNINQTLLEKLEV